MKTKTKNIIIVSATVIAVVAVIIGVIIAVSQSDKSASPQKYLDLGNHYLLELDYEQALVQFKRVIEIDPKNIPAYLGGTDAYLHLNNTQGAVDWLTAGINATDNENLTLVLTGVEKSVVEGYIALAEAYEAEDLHEKALELLKRVYDETGDEIIGRKLGIIKASEIQFRDDYIIDWEDTAFENLIRQYLGKENGDIHYDDVKLIEKIEIWRQIIAKPDEQFWTSYSENDFEIGDGRKGLKDGQIKTLADLEHFTSLKDLSVNYQESLDISALTKTDKIDCLHRLETLILNGDNITNISIVSELIALRSLSLAYNDITDISPISLLIELQNISLVNNKQISSVEPLKGLRKLSYVVISGVNAVDLSIFVGMPELRNMNLVDIENIDYSILKQLHLDYLEITCDDATFQIVKQLTTLTSLRLHGQGIWSYDEGDLTQTGVLTNISGIEQLINLTKLDLLAFNCHDISPLAALKIKQLELYLPNDCDLNPLTQISSLEKVVVPDIYYSSETSESDSLIDRVRAILPNVEVATDWR